MVYHEKSKYGLMIVHITFLIDSRKKKLRALSALSFFYSAGRFSYPSVTIS